MESIKKALDVLDDVKTFWSPSKIPEIELAIKALQLQAKIQNIISEIDRKHDNYDIMLIKEVKDILNELIID